MKENVALLQYNLNNEPQSSTSIYCMCLSYTYMEEFSGMIGDRFLDGVLLNLYSCLFPNSIFVFGISILVFTFWPYWNLILNSHYLMVVEEIEVLRENHHSTPGHWQLPHLPKQDSSWILCSQSKSDDLQYYSSLCVEKIFPSYIPHRNHVWFIKVDGLQFHSSFWVRDLRYSSDIAMVCDL